MPWHVVDFLQAYDAVPEFCRADAFEGHFAAALPEARLDVELFILFVHERNEVVLFYVVQLVEEKCVAFARDVDAARFDECVFAFPFEVAVRRIDFAVVRDGDGVSGYAEDFAHHVVLVPHDAPDKVSVLDLFGAAGELAHPQDAVLCEFGVQRVVLHADGFHDVMPHENHERHDDSEDQHKEKHVRSGMASL